MQKEKYLKKGLTDWNHSAIIHIISIRDIINFVTLHSL